MINQHNFFHKNIRLQGYDYSQSGAYFVTICTYNRRALFGEIANSEMILNEYGNILVDVWQNLPEHFINVSLDYFVVMPNHFHGVIILDDTKETKRYTLPGVVRSLKSFFSREINKLRNSHGAPVWQRNYYEYIVRDERELNRIREYIQYNPYLWNLDRENPERTGISPLEKKVLG